MSEDSSSLLLSLAEKFVGIVLIILSIIVFYYTATSSALSGFTGLFAFLGVVVLISGALLIVVKPPE
jgi:hypothetical protein